MRTAKELEEIGDLYALENTSQFEVPNELDLEFVDDCSCVNTALRVARFAERRADSRTDSQSLENGRETDGGSEMKKRKNASMAPADNIGPTKYQFPRNWGGYDGGCEASFQGEWNDQFNSLLERLDVAKQAADDGKSGNSFINFGGRVWCVRAAGAREAGFVYKYVMESEGVKLYIHSNPKNGIPPVCVRFGFECLAKKWLFDAADELRDSLAMEGFKITDEKIGRVDMQVLLPVNILEFVNAIQPGPRICTRCRGELQMYANLKTGKIETITIKSENCELCIYDKHEQVIQSDPVYYALFCKSFFGDEETLLPEDLTRVEFRFSREMLRRYGINTFDDLRNSASALLEIASGDWFRILERDKVRGSEREIPDAEIWRYVRAAFDYYFRETLPTSRTWDDLKDSRPLRNPPAVERLVKQGMGCLASAAAFVLEKVYEVPQLVKYYSELVTNEAEATLDKVISRQIMNQIVRGFSRSPKRDYTTLEEVQEGLAPIGFPEFWGLEGAGWELG